MRTWTAALILGACPFLFADDDAAMRAEVEALSKGYESALEAFFQPLTDAKTEEERAKVRLDWTRHPLQEWLPKAQVLAERAKGTEAAIPVLLWILTHAGETGEPPKELIEGVVKSLLEDHIQSPSLEEAPAAIRNQCTWVLGTSATEKLLAKIAAGSPHSAVRAAALYHAGAVVLDDAASTEEDRARATALLQRVMDEYNATSWARQASGYLHGTQSLHAGQAAPDFEATDVEGAKFSLSDYRGKVVVVKFWGFW